MSYYLDRQDQTVTIEGREFSPADFKGDIPSVLANRSAFHRELGDFLSDWFKDSPTLTVYTSGSTGQPKVLSVEKSRMMQSAHLTCAFLQLKERQSVLLCMSLKYIAAKMIVVRALVAGLDIYPVEPDGHPLKATSQTFDFAAMVPLQVYNSLQIREERQRLAEIKALIIGGGALDSSLERQLQSFPYPVYSSYGMTETLSHIALRRINGAGACPNYIPFESVTLSLSDEGTLCIEAPLVASERLQTNDVAELFPDGSFRILGRKDNIINSGGVKIQIETIESLLEPLIPFRFTITSLPDPKFGEQVVLVSEAPLPETIDFKAVLPPYSIPKQFFVVSRLPLTETGKINRPALREILTSSGAKSEDR